MPACALPPLPARVFGVQLYERSHSLRNGKSLQVLRFCGFQLCAEIPVCRHSADKADWYGHPWRPSTVT
jgi:hypothetical protein